MPWEEVIVQSHGNFGFNPLTEDIASIALSKVKNSTMYRVNAVRKNFGDSGFVKIKIDREKKRVGFFKASPEAGRKVVGYGKDSRLMYVSCPKVLGEIGFTKGRYNIHRMKDPAKNPDLLFYISVEDKIAESVEKVEDSED